jgi:transcriptional regulator with XRE-family HTH domain
MATGDWLQNARRRAGYASEEALAEAMGISRGAVGNWETGRNRPSMANAERLAVLLRRDRSEVLAKFGYPIGGGEPPLAALSALPPEWLAAVRAEVAAGIADGLAEVLRMLRDEGLLPRADTAPRRRPARRSDG